MSPLGSSPAPAVIDAAGDDLAQQLVRVSALPPEAFRHLQIQNRPTVPQNGAAVGLQYFRYGIGGGEKATYALAKLFCEQGVRVVVYVDELADEDERLPLPEGAVCKAVPHEPAERARFWLGEAASERLRCVVYGTWLSPRAPLDCLALQCAGAAVAFQTHGTATYLFDCPGNADCWDVVLRCAYAADAVVCLSESDRVFWGAFNRNVRTVVNPLSLYMDEPCADDADPVYDVVFCGRLDAHEKRPAEALRMFAAARGRLPHIRMAFVGDGPARRELEDLGAELGVSGAVDYLGFKADPRGIIRKAGVLVLTSPSEGFALVLGEAACLGTPCVVYENPHLATLRGNAGTLQVPQGDWEAGGAAIAGLLCDRDAYARAAQAGREFYEKALCVDHAAIWSQVLDGAVQAAGRLHVAPDPADNPAHALVFNAVAASRREARRCRDFEDRMNAEWRRANAAEEELRALRESLSYRLGRMLTWLPRKLRR